MQLHTTLSCSGEECLELLYKRMTAYVQPPEPYSTVKSFFPTHFARNCTWASQDDPGGWTDRTRGRSRANRVRSSEYLVIHRSLCNSASLDANQKSRRKSGRKHHRVCQHRQSQRLIVVLLRPALSIDLMSAVGRRHRVHEQGSTICSTSYKPDQHAYRNKHLHSGQNLFEEICP
jgi:hypothetical protein